MSKESILKRICVGVVVGTLLLTGCSQTSLPEKVTEITEGDVSEKVTEITESEVPEEVAIDPEVLRGIELGLVDASYLDEPELPGTTEDIEKIVSKILVLYGASEDKIAEWEERATGTNMTAYNSDVAKACYYTSVYLSEDGIPKTNANDNSGTGRVLAADWNRDPKSIEWEGFIKIEEGEFSWYNREQGYHGEDAIEIAQWNHVAAGMFSAAMASHYSGQYVLPQDYETDTLLLNTPLNRAELLLRMVRIYDSFEKPAEYVSIDSLGDENVISEEVIQNAKGVPEVNEKGFSNEWIGSSLGNYSPAGIEGSDGSLRCSDLTWNLREADFAAIADLGTNYIRIQFMPQTLFYPDYSEDRSKINKEIIEELDQAICWAMKYGLHVSLAITQYMDDDIDGVNEIDIGSGAVISTFTPSRYATKEQYNDKKKMIEQLAKRYSNVPTKYLSFEIENEVSLQLKSDSTPTHTADEVADEYISMAQAVWNVTSERGISMTSDVVNLTDEELAFWTKIAQAGINLDYHSYEPRSFMQPTSTRKVDADQMVWPGFVDENGVEWDIDKYYDEFIAPWKMLADENGVGFKVGECIPCVDDWSLFETPIRTQNTMVAFANDFSRKLQENHVSYSINETVNNISAIHDIEPADTDIVGYFIGANYSLKTYHLDNYTCTFYVNEEYAQACYGKK